MPTVGFEPTISAGERPQTDVLNRAATGTDVTIKHKDKCKPHKSLGVVAGIQQRTDETVEWRSCRVASLIALSWDFD
jgi:hypothetical protein